MDEEIQDAQVRFSWRGRELNRLHALIRSRQDQIQAAAVAPTQEDMAELDSLILQANHEAELLRREYPIMEVHASQLEEPRESLMERLTMVPLFDPSRVQLRRATWAGNARPAELIVPTEPASNTTEALENLQMMLGEERVRAQNVPVTPSESPHVHAAVDIRMVDEVHLDERHQDTLNERREAAYREAVQRVRQELDNEIFTHAVVQEASGQIQQQGATADPGIVAETSRRHSRLLYTRDLSSAATTTHTQAVSSSASVQPAINWRVVPPLSTDPRAATVAAVGIKLREEGMLKAYMVGELDKYALACRIPRQVDLVLNTLSAGSSPVKNDLRRDIIALIENLMILNSRLAAENEEYYNTLEGLADKAQNECDDHALAEALKDACLEDRGDFPAFLKMNLSYEGEF